MREIKFRIWDKKNKLMFYSDTNLEDYVIKYFSQSKLIYCDMEGFAIGSNGELYLIDECGSVEYLDRNNFEVLWFTGFHDRNCKEVYEGDILQQGAWRPISVIFRDSSFRGNNPASFIHNEVINQPRCNFCVIIGNIYENPALISADAV